MVRPRPPRRTTGARSFRQLRRFHHVSNPDKVLGTHRALVRFNVRSGSDTVEPIPSYGDLETIGYGKDNVVMRKAAATTPLRAMPLAVLANARPFELPREAEGFSSDALESVLRAANEDLATLVTNARFFVAKDSGHDIHQDQPELVTEAIRQVVTGVRDPDTWYDLASCCAK